MCFHDDIQRLLNGKPVSPSLASLTPFLDSLGHLRVGGRLKNSSLSYKAKHPLLLPKTAHISVLLCDHYHLISLHSGPRTVQALISKFVWIISSRSLVRQQTRKCFRCYKFRAHTVQPLMADLPSSRTKHVRAFYRTGTDFAGPFHLKESNRRKPHITKCYLCLFICMSSKAVHLEAVTELSTPAFLAAFDRFVSRRGLPTDLYSD